MAEIVLETGDLTKEFAGFVAVNGVSLRVARGTIHALTGPNGAGKTTCFNRLTKFLKPARRRIADRPGLADVGRGGDDGFARRSWYGLGPVVGTFIIIAMQNDLAHLGQWATVIQCVTFVLCVMLFRRGVVGEIAHCLRIRL